VPVIPLRRAAEDNEELAASAGGLVLVWAIIPLGDSLGCRGPTVEIGNQPSSKRQPVNPTPGPASLRFAVGIVVYAAYDRRLVDYLRALTVVSYRTFLDAGLHVSSDSMAPC
jgi:hypothetical protein